MGVLALCGCKAGVKGWLFGNRGVASLGPAPSQHRHTWCQLLELPAIAAQPNSREQHAFAKMIRRYSCWSWMIGMAMHLIRTWLQVKDWLLFFSLPEPREPIAAWLGVLFQGDSDDHTD